MKISVIIPVYKVESYLRQCVDSVLNQTYKDLEIILVDDGSPDGSPAICDEYAKIDNRVKVIHKNNGGLSDARNHGIAAATGDYVVCLDSDDWWTRADAIEGASSLLEEKPDILFFDRITYCDNGIVIHPKGMSLESINGLNRSQALKKLMSNGKFIPSACNKFVKREIVTNGNVSFKKGLVCEDIDWTYQMMPYVTKIMGYGIPFYGYRKRGDSITAKIGKKNMDDLLYIIEYWSKRCEETETDKDCRYQLLGYLNYQRFIAMGFIFTLPENEQRELLPRVDSLSWLEKYDVNKKTRLALIAHMLGGGMLTRFILSSYIKLKRKGLKIQ